MGILYPGAVDNFTTPSSPETTPLSEAGDGTRNHSQSIHDLGLAAEALETYTSKRQHDHSGDATDPLKGPKLAQANTHESPDTDASPTALHHTLGTGANQAARGNHIHDYSVITNTPYRIVTSTTRPSSPFIGLAIYETDTGFRRVWTGTAWTIDTGLKVPVVRAQQSQAQQLDHTGTVVQFDQELEDNNGFFNPAVSKTDFHIADAGLYHIDTAVQWNPSIVPDTTHLWLTVNGIDTSVRFDQWLRGGGLFNPGFSQTLSLSGKLRLNAGDTLRVKASFTVPNDLLSLIFSFFDGPSKITTRVEIGYMGQ